MPAAAVIPAPIAYIKVVAVKKLVVECGAGVGCVGTGGLSGSLGPCAHLAHWVASLSGLVLDLNACIRRVSLQCGAC